jgi:hypothetical protein
MAKDELNPQPLPPKSISFEQFTESVTASVLRAIQSHVATTNSPEWKNPRIIIGIIAEPKLEATLQSK